LVLFFSEDLALGAEVLKDLNGLGQLKADLAMPHTIGLTVWRDPHTPQRERKRMLALLVEDITLLKQRQVTAHVRFRGGATTTLTLPRPLTAWELRATSPDARQHMNALLDEYTDAQVAAILNQRGLRTGAGDTFEPANVQWVRFSAKLKSLKERLLEAGMLTSKQVSVTLGVSRDHHRPTPQRRPAQGAHLQRPRRMAVLAARDDPVADECLVVHRGRPRRHIHCGRCSMRSAPSRLMCWRAPIVEVGCG
jgi:hypothetical protein